MTTIRRCTCGACAEWGAIAHRERISVCLWDCCRPGLMAQSQAADGQPDCSHIRSEFVSANERNRSLTFGLRKTQFSQHAWFRKLILKIVSLPLWDGANKEVVEQHQLDKCNHVRQWYLINSHLKIC